jgi:hypothetical protein
MAAASGRAFGIGAFEAGPAEEFAPPAAGDALGRVESIGDDPEEATNRGRSHGGAMVEGA